MMEEQWKAAAMADAQKVCDLTDLTTDLAEALEVTVKELVHWSDKESPLAQSVISNAKAVLKKAGRQCS